MRVEGESTIPRGLNKAAAALREPRVIHYFLPGLQKMRPQRDGSVEFSLVQGVGPFSLTLHGTARLVAVEVPHLFRLELDARHRVGGQVTGRFDITLSLREPGLTNASFAGEVTATGLTKRILGLRPDLPQILIARGFDRLRVELRREAKIAWAAAGKTGPAAAPVED